MLSTYKPKSIQVIGFDRFDYDFLKNIRRDLVISIPFIHAQEINYVVDANGNLISDGKYYREYNGLNQLVRLGNTSKAPFWKNTDGILLRKGLLPREFSAMEFIIIPFIILMKTL